MIATGRVFISITISYRPYRHVIKAVFIFNFILQFETKPTSLILQKSITEVYYRSSVLQKFLQEYLTAILLEETYNKMVDTINIKDLTLLEWALLKMVYTHIKFVLLQNRLPGRLVWTL